MMNDLYISCGAPVKKVNNQDTRHCICFGRKNLFFFQLARFPGGTHNETWTIPNYYQTINYFLDEVKIKLNIQLAKCLSDYTLDLKDTKIPY